jgi:predicted ATPase
MIREKVTGRLLSLDRALEPFLPALLWLLDVHVDDPSWERLDPPQRRRQTLDGVKRLLLRESLVQPVVVIFEDLHWIDVETQALVDALVESIPAARMLMLVNYRPEYQHAWGSKTYYRQLRIDTLPPASAHELLDAMLGHDATIQPLKVLLVQRTEGTPFFLEESVRTLVETRVLDGERGAYRLAKALATIDVPVTVKALLAARIDRLPPEDKAVLQAASVIGTDVPFELLHAIAGLSQDELRQRLADLQSAEFLYETNLFPALEFTFKHALTHEVAYGSLLGERKRALHARIVEAIERLHTDRLNEHVERLASHAVRGEVWEQAVTYLHEAGTKAFRRSAVMEAVAYFTQALEIVAGRLPDTPARRRRELQVLLALGPAFQISKGFGAPDVERAFSRARQLSEEVGEPVEMYRALWGLWLHTLGGQGRFEAGRRLAEELVALAERIGDRALRLEAHHAMAPSTLWNGDPEASRTHCEEGIALYDPEQHATLAFAFGGHDAGVCCRMHSALALWILGYPAASIERCRAGLTLARDLAHVGSIVNALPFAAIIHQLRGDVPALRNVCESMSTLSSEHGLPQWAAFARILDRWVEADTSGGADAMARLQQAIADYRAAGNELYVPFYQALTASAQLRHGTYADGLATIEAALSDVNQSGLWDAEFYRLKGELLLASDAATAVEAEDAFRHAIDIARRQHAKSWELRAAMRLCRLWHRQKKQADAIRLLEETRSWFTEGDDTADLREARALLDSMRIG